MEFTRRSEFIVCRVLRLLVRTPASPLAVSSTLRVSANRRRSYVLNDMTYPLFDFGVPPEFFPIDPSLTRRRSVALGSSHGLPIPSAHAGNEDPLDAGFA
jgi:hypothetical protein